MTIWNSELIATSTAASSRLPHGEVVPDEDHGDAAGEADDDQAGAQLGEVGEEHPGEGEHQQRADHPVQDERDAQGAAVGELVADVRVADLGQDRVHHRQQPDGDRQRDGVDLDALERVVEIGDQPAQAEAGGHGQADPQRQEPVEGRELGGDRPGVGLRGHHGAQQQPDSAGVRPGPG